MADDSWQPRRFGDLATLSRNTVTPDAIDDCVYIGLEHIGEGTLSLLGTGTSSDVTSTKNRFRAGQILFGKLRPYFRKVVRPNFDGVCSTDIWVIDPTSDTDPDFLFYLVASDSFVEPVVRASEGTKMPRAKWDYARDLIFDVPRHDEQRAIGAVLRAIDDKIGLNRRMAQTLEEMARALFKSWFVDFDPVRAKAEGRDPGLPKHLADLFPDRIVNSELGEIPDGWDSAALSDVATLTQRSIKPGSHPDRAWAHFSIPAFDAGRMPFSEFGRQIKSGKYRVPSVCVLISKLNPSTPRVWLPDVTDEEWSICSTEFLPFVPVRVEWRSFLYELLRSAPFEEAVLSRVSGSTGSRQRVLPGDVASLRFVRPDDALIGEFSRLATHWHERTLAAMREAAELSALRELLLPLLVSGELRLPDPEGLLARLEAVG